MYFVDETNGNVYSPTQMEIVAKGIEWRNDGNEELIQKEYEETWHHMKKIEVEEL